jgi:heme oxygenase
MSMVEIMPRLKSETRDEHTATERTALARAMLQGTMTRAEYKAQLGAYRLVHEAIDRRLASSPFAAAIAGPSPKTARLAGDLGNLASVEETRGRGVEGATRSLVALIDGALPAALLGIVYVMEGSSLGAAILYPRLKDALGLPAEALTYYCGDGSATLDRWRAFGARMNAALVEPDDQERALAAARATFVGLRRLFEAIAPSVSETTATTLRDSA